MGKWVHGKRGTRLYCIWASMKTRCLNPNSKTFKHYGGRGIKFCKAWIAFMPFYLWAMSNGYRDGLTLERIDNNGNYEPDNCKWITWKEQHNNTRKNIILCFNGEKKNLEQWAVFIGMKSTTLYRRIVLSGWSTEKALTTPVRGY